MADRIIRTVVAMLVLTGILWNVVSQDAFAEPSRRKFEDIGLFELEDSHFETLTTNLEDRISRRVPVKDVFDLFDEGYEMIIQKLQNVEWMDIRSNLDRDTIFTEYPAENSAYIQWNDALCLIAKQICETPDYESSARSRWGDAAVEAYLSYEPLTKEQKDTIEEIHLINQQIDELRAEQSVAYQGKEYTLSVLEQERISGNLTNDEYYSVYYELVHVSYQQIAPLFIELVNKRNTLAQTMDYDNYMEYAYEAVYERDYTYEEADELRGYMIRELLPDYRKLEQALADVAIDGTQDTFSVEKGVDIMETYLPLIDPGFCESMEFMQKQHLCDLDDAGGKVDFSFVAELSYDEEAFLSIHGVDDIYDLATLAHELGHYNAIYHSPEDYWRQVCNQMDIAEIHSQGNELLLSLFYDDFTQDAALAQATGIYDILSQMIYSVLMDAIEKDIYTSENLTPEDIDASFAKWMSLYYGVEFDSDSILASIWIMQDVLFSSPCYFISYVTSGFTALDIFVDASEYYHAGVEAYRGVVSGGWSCGYREQIAVCGLHDPFEEKDFSIVLDKAEELWNDCLQGKAAKAPEPVKKYRISF